MLLYRKIRPLMIYLMHNLIEKPGISLDKNLIAHLKKVSKIALLLPVFQNAFKFYRLSLWIE